VLLIHTLIAIYEAELDEGWTLSRLEVELILHASVVVGMDRTRLIRAVPLLNLLDEEMLPVVWAR
jgi:hypothetical protein